MRRAVAGALAGAAVALAGGACDTSRPPAPEPPEPAPAGTLAKGAPRAGTVRVSGSSALQPLVNAAKERFEARHRSISVEVSAGGSKKGLADVASGAVDVGDSDIFAAPDLAARLVDHRVAVVAFAVMANKGPYDAKVKALGLQDLARVFTGAVTDWKDIGGDPQPIVVINRAPDSGTRAVFGEVVLGGDKFVEAQTEDNSGALVAKLEQTKGAISYLALSFAEPSLRVFSLETGAGTADPTPADVTTGKYPIWSYEHMYTLGPPSGPTKELLDYMLSDDFQERVLPGVRGFIPVTRMKVSRQRD